jgi:hypothetical protein
LLSGAPPRSHDSVVCRKTPAALANYLAANPPSGQIFNTYEWGDYLLWTGPRGLRVFVASHAHLLPNPVWRDYLAVVRREPGWKEVLERYQVTAIVVDRRYRSGLIAELSTDPLWRIQFEDDLGVVFGRVGDRGLGGLSPEP